MTGSKNPVTESAAVKGHAESNEKDPTELHKLLDKLNENEPGLLENRYIEVEKNNPKIKSRKGIICKSWKRYNIVIESEDKTVRDVIIDTFNKCDGIKEANYVLRDITTEWDRNPLRFGRNKPLYRLDPLDRK